MAGDLALIFRLIDMGMYVFPVPINAKIPMCRWSVVSTRDKEIVKTWFVDDLLGKPCKTNIGIDMGKSGMLGVDVDCKNGKVGLETWKSLKAKHPSTPTFMVRTPSGGYHLYYRSSDFGNTSSTLMGKDIDTRGEGGYLIAPSSYVIDGRYGYEGEYTVENDLPPAKLPEWIMDLLNPSRMSLRHEENGIVHSVDHEHDVAWAQDFLAHHEGAIQGQSGDHRTYVTFCQLKEHGLSCEKAFELVLGHWNHKCVPVWSIEELERKAHSAYASARNATGVKSAHVEFADVPLPQPARLEIKNRYDDDGFTFDFNGIPTRDWVYGDLCLRKAVTVIIAPPGQSKSTLMVHIGVSKTTDIPILGIPTRGIGRVVYHNNEDSLEEMQRRLSACAQAYGIGKQQFFDKDVRGEPQRSRFTLQSGERNRLRIATRDPRTGKIKPYAADQLAEELINLGIDIFIVDPYAETHPAQENSNEESLEIAAIYRSVAQFANIAIILVHHTRKQSGASSEGHSGNMDSMRGASSLAGVARVVATLDGMTEKEAKRLGIREKDRHTYTKLEGAKANFTLQGGSTRWFQKNGYSIGQTMENPDGENIGYLRPVTFANAEERINPELKLLVEDIETAVREEPLLSAEVARRLVTHFPSHLGKQPRTLEKAIHRLFDSEGVCTATYGVLHMKEETAAGRILHIVRHIPSNNTQKRRSLSDML